MILILNIVVSMTGGISIVMLIPMLGLLDISEASVSALSILAAPLQKFSYSWQVCILIGLYFLLIVFKSLLGRALSLRECAFIENYSYNLRRELYHTVSEADWEKLKLERQADTVDLFTRQCGEISYGVSDVIHLVSSLFSAMVQLAVAVWLSLPITVFVLICGCIYVVAFRRLMRISKEYGAKMMQLNRSMYAELFNQLRGVKEVRSYNVQREHAALFEEISYSFKSAKLEYMRQRSVPQVIYSCAAAFMIGVIFLVCVLCFRMDTARLMVLVYVFMRLWPVFSGLYGTVQSIQSSVPAFEKLREAFVSLARTERPAGNAQPLVLDKEIRFENVSFSYQDGDEAVLKNVSFSLKKGTITALAGRSGAGKTTLADLLLGFLIPTDGEILIDGITLTRDNLPSWRRALGYVPQEPLILNASVRENLQRFHPNATEEEMIFALQKAQAWSFVSGLKDGLDTMLGDDGVRLSGGERQRIVMARVLLGRPQLIVMDEATSAMDYESEAA
ncbi:MAG: ABC transporter ATP-binding protein, partial [Clostridia bacterium]|nr:ABC transporter ATP-binding protein [Clostridia bacterium]